MRQEKLLGVKFQESLAEIDLSFKYVDSVRQVIIL